MFRLENNKIILYDGDQVMGYVFFSTNVNIVNILQVYVNPLYRGRGVANRLMKYTYRYFEKRDREFNMMCTYAKKWLEKRNQSERGR